LLSSRLTRYVWVMDDENENMGERWRRRESEHFIDGEQSPMMIRSTWMYLRTYEDVVSK
jgi:hypothetical protein